MKIATYNINNVNRRLPNLLAWLKRARPDIVCLQELKAADEAFPQAELRKAGYHALWRGQKTWNGVAILSRKPPILTRKALPGDPGDAQSRYIEAAIDGLLDRLPLPPQRQSAARAEVQVQARLVRPPAGARQKTAEERRTRRTGRRLQCRADRLRHLFHEFLEGRCAGPT